MTDQNQGHHRIKELIGLIPAGGSATRIDPLPCSKELFPVRFYSARQKKNVSPKVISHCLLEKMRRADIQKAYFILRQGKWDIPAYFGDGKMLDMHIGYLMMDMPYGVPFTLDQAYPFIKNATIVFGFPDIIFQPEDAFMQLLSKQEQTDADIVLGLFEAEKPQKMDMVEIDNQGNICRIEIKPKHTHLRYTWIIAVWTNRFTEFMHKLVIDLKNGNNGKNSSIVKNREFYAGDVIQAAIDAEIRIEKVIFSNDRYIDIGTPSDLARAVHHGVGPQEGWE